MMMPEMLEALYQESISQNAMNPMAELERTFLPLYSQ